MKLERAVNDRQWVLLEETYPHTIRLTEIECKELKEKLQVKRPHLDYKCFYDAYYKYIEYYSEGEKEQINRLVP